MGTTAADWIVSGALTANGTIAFGTDDSGYLTTYNWLIMDGAGVKTHGLKVLDHGTGAYVLMYVRNGVFYTA